MSSCEYRTPTSVWLQKVTGREGKISLGLAHISLFISSGNFAAENGGRVFLAWLHRICELGCCVVQSSNYIKYPLHQEILRTVTVFID